VYIHENSSLEMNSSIYQLVKYKQTVYLLTTLYLRLFINVVIRRPQQNKLSQHLSQDVLVFILTGEKKNEMMTD